MSPEQFYTQSSYPTMTDKFDKSRKLFDYYDLLDFAQRYHDAELNQLDEIELEYLIT